MAHTKAGGSTTNLRDSRGQRLGVKLFAGEKAHVGSVIIRQCGTKYLPGKNVKRGNNDTLYAAITGTIRFTKKKVPRFTGRLHKKTIVAIIPEQA
ncbi:MAG: 50S ribosomal protein L27 [Candidatus Kerfeldbacteria bacterium RIFCSPHIGHO2_02_FULL_42_14]|uniref:Large ribosomal subunit protein bL27 n=1 Tax=Candidatus Kerfeldbacteria bacterium RIFCSPHIGHO2_02_FULL_42_14 TaxID=1798540 RepID=A0A1G2AV94_9BACT|nr:MAG: 50S ribosomal protein L27 [Candidatus Kerfeldbacteria bacterium RIFCSPHIGHO2_02_FULL_42_14]OGY82315.1 MAG: 50S ribosomal protein L27 [Candidatus Kerfeldbacteria bacterium RIFCSPHIGHO2_12_FULL_42_13]OGY84743.1 MAG: 50S ribosomal protein L27 [Candidatus Kerfeldbacteria bacterium RIFCSPLOWO2_02_FULL_42_19]OGY85973.1 MAG: 50S ribosomal protein L27 [Candidatus Kerfeldbacteria bacterium RIFCSPLOWO2_12_FULL_43_9]